MGSETFQSENVESQGKYKEKRIQYYESSRNFSTKTINFTCEPEWFLNEQNYTYSQSRVDGHQGPGRVYQYLDL